MARNRFSEPTQSDPIAIFETSVSQQQVDDFFSAIGWSLPKKTIPPTLATLFRDGEFEALKKLNVPLDEVLHGEQKYKFHQDIKSGEKLKAKTFIDHQFEKAQMVFYTFRTDIYSEDGKICLECHSTIIHRKKIK